VVEAYYADELDQPALARLLDRERDDAWGTWVVDEVGAMLLDRLRERLDGIDRLAVTAWSLDYYAGAVVEGDVVDGRAFATALGAPDHDLGWGVSLAPQHGGGQWPGTTYVLVHTGEGSDHRDDVLTEALGRVVAEVVAEVSQWAEDVTSDGAILAGLVDAAWWYTADGRYLADVVEVIS
jgi:hypothetical protein